jgi:hypothetical protein
MNTITDDELIQACIAAWFETPGEMTTRMGAVLARSEQKQATLIGDLTAMVSTLKRLDAVTCAQRDEALARIAELEAQAAQPAQPVGIMSRATYSTSSGAGYKQISFQFAELHDANQVLLWAKSCGAAPKPAQVAAPEGWQPIETAPKDGAELLLFAPGRVTYGAWHTPSVTPRIVYRDGFAPEPEYEEFVPFWASWDGGFTDEHPPTHWMPLPAAPKQEGGEHA